MNATILEEGGGGGVICLEIDVCSLLAQPVSGFAPAATSEPRVNPTEVALGFICSTKRSKSVKPTSMDATAGLDWTHMGP